MGDLILLLARQKYLINNVNTGFILTRRYCTAEIEIKVEFEPDKEFENHDSSYVGP